MSRDNLSVFPASRDLPQSLSVDLPSTSISSNHSLLLPVCLKMSPPPPPRLFSPLSSLISSDNTGFELEKKVKFVAGAHNRWSKLLHFWRMWHTIGASNKVVRKCLKGYRLLFAPYGERRDVATHWCMSADANHVIPAAFWKKCCSF